jgi:ribonuclease D
MFGDTPLVLVETNDDLLRCVEQLGRSTVIGVDTESDSFHHYREKVCLVQISDQHTDFVIDPLRVPDMAPLGEVFANRDICKVFHGADYDVVCLKRDFGVKMHNIFDTMISAQFLALPRVGLADLIYTWWGWHLDKKWQRHDWAARPLLDEHLDYARGDSHWLPTLRDLFLRRLEKAGQLAPVLEECAVLEAREWVRPRHDPADFYRVKGSRQMDEVAQRALRAVYRFRDTEAERQDRPAFKVLPEDILYELAVSRPLTMEALNETFRRGAPFIRRYGEGLVAALNAGVVSTDELPAAGEVRKREPGLRGPRAERLMNALKDWRNDVVRRTGLPPIAVASNGVLKELTRVAPRTVEELATVPDLRNWQGEQYGSDWIAIVARVLGPERDAGADDPEEARPARRRRRRGEPREEGSAGESEAAGSEPGPE